MPEHVAKSAIFDVVFKHHNTNTFFAYGSDHGPVKGLVNVAFFYDISSTRLNI